MGKIKVNNYVLRNPKIKHNKTILCLSDTHGNINNIKDILEVIKQIKVDYILVAGDIIDYLEQERQDEFFDELVKLSNYAKTYITIGNHELYRTIKKGVLIDLDEIKKSNMKDKLSNVPNLQFFCDKFSYVDIDEELGLAVINLNHDYFSNKESTDVFDKFIKGIEKDKNYKKLDNNKFNILLSHSPNAIIRKKKIIDNCDFIKKCDLTLCGHNHGGLIHPFFQDLFRNHYGLFGPYNRLVEPNAYGYWSNNERSVLVSSGVTKIGKSAPFNLLHTIVNKILIPELDLITIETGKEHKFRLVNRKNYKIK